MEMFWAGLAVVIVLGFIATRVWPEVTTAIGVALGIGAYSFWESITAALFGAG